MGFQDNVKADIGLRNLTIYAQWLSISAAILLYLRAFVSLLYALLAPSSNNRYIQDPSDLLFNIAIWCLFPLAPLALELPQYMRQKFFFYASILTQITSHARSLYFGLFNHSGYFAIRIRDYVPLVVLFMASILVLGHIGAREFPPGLVLRASVNVLYLGNLIVSILMYRVGWEWEVLGWYTRCIFLIDCVNGSMFGMAALLYNIAWTRRHTWVPSRTLGGTGIEPMLLMIPGRGPLHQSIGDEAGEGVIRLV